MKCSDCGGILHLNSGLYVCSKCKRIATSPVSGACDVFICCTQINSQGNSTVDSTMATDIYNRLALSGISAFYSPKAFLGTPENVQRYNEEAAIESARIIIITGSTKFNFESTLLSYRSKFKNKAILPVYSTMARDEIPKTADMFPPINYDNKSALDNICNDIRGILKLLESRSAPISTKTKREKRRKTTFVLGLIFALAVCFGITAYFMAIEPRISDAKDYKKAQSLTTEGKYVEAMSIYSGLGNYKDSVDLIGKIYSGYNGFYKNTEKMIDLNLSIVNKVAKIDISEHYGNKTITTSTSGNVKNNIIEFKYTDSSGISGKGTLKLLNNSVNLTINSEDTNKYCISSGTTVFLCDEISVPVDIPETKELTKKVLIGWLNGEKTKSDIENMGYKLKQIETAYPYEGIQSVRYRIIDHSITLEFLTPSGSSADSIPVNAIWAPAGIVMENQIGQEPRPFEQNGTIYWPGKSVFWNHEGNWSTVNIADENSLRQSTTVTVVTHNSYEKYNYNWDNLMHSIVQRNIGVSVDSDYFDIEAQTAEKYLVGVNEGNYTKYYEVDKNTYKSSYIAKITPDETYSGSQPLWHQRPELFGEFLENTPKSYDTLYRVRKSAWDETSQLGAFSILENAINTAINSKDAGYKVYDSNGNLVYEP